MRKPFIEVSQTTADLGLVAEAYRNLFGRGSHFVAGSELPEVRLGSIVRRLCDSAFESKML